MLNIFSKLTGVMDKAKLIAVALLVVMIAACAVVIHVRDNIIEVLQADNNRLTLERELALSERDKAQAEIVRQNELISAHQLRMDEAISTYHNEIARLRAQAGQTKIQVVKELIADPSCDNKLRLIKQIQDGIYAK